MKDLVVRKMRPIFIPDNSFHFFVIGAGGTGGHLIPNLARLVSASNTEDFKHEITIIDGDVVEEKNILRQNFIAKDIGKNKAMVLAERYSAAFGIEIHAVPEFIEQWRKLASLMSEVQRPSIPVVIGCVDNHKTRQMIHSAFLYAYDFFPMIWIDGANEEFTGQVVFGSMFPLYYVRRCSRSTSAFFVPPVTLLYPEVLKDEGTKFNSELSCAERAISAPQSISANLTSANIIMNYVSTLLAMKDTGYGIRAHQVRFNTKNNSFSTDWLYEDVVSKFESPLDLWREFRRSI